MLQMMEGKIDSGFPYFTFMTPNLGHFQEFKFSLTGRSPGKRWRIEFSGDSINSLWCGLEQGVGESFPLFNILKYSYIFSLIGWRNQPE